jgi:hypothetical protein
MIETRLEKRQRIRIVHLEDAIMGLLQCNGLSVDDLDVETYEAIQQANTTLSAGTTKRKRRAEHYEK